ncbi:MAG: enoyl-CoA hydratase/isomerase family protein [Gammaproteobacteria bacterium]|nr:enoyl-CoA hydratase/isomerase family protein [Gammaproteobacteria bacterium]
MDKQQDVIRVVPLESGILQLNLNRPEQRNALSHETLATLLQILQTAKADASVKAILLMGEGKAFCAGADINQLAGLTGPSALEFARFGQTVFRYLELLGKPSLAAMHGCAFGGGCELAMATTLRLAATNTIFGQPEIKLGVIPGFGGTQRLARLIGKGRALEICLTGRRFTAEEALQWGFLNEITSPENLLVRAKALLTEIVQFGTVALQGILSTIHYGYDLSMEEACELEAAQFGLCCTTADKLEGVSAFLEKRPAVFNGK